MTGTQPGALQSASLMASSRVVSLFIGLLSIPVLIRYLGGEGFAAWAVLLALSAGFSLLELGMPTTMVRFLAVPARDGNWAESRALFGRMWVLLGVSFGAGLVATLLLAPSMASWLRLPGSTLLSALEMIHWVFAATALRAFLKTGTLSLYAARRFREVSLVALLQPLCANVAAMLAAWKYGRLDIALIAYWAAQLCVPGITFFLSRHMCAPRFTRDTLDARGLRELFVYGLASQMEGWAQFVNFQFDKFLIAGLVGLWGVAPYEVANRAVVALRSVPASGAETFLPTAMTHAANRDEAWRWYVSSTRIAAYGVCLFLLVPLVAAPMFLYAWTGQMGYVGRWAFVALAFGAMASVLAFPAATLMQAAGRPGVPGKASAYAILLNVPLSLIFVLKWGVTGAAIGTAVAMVVSASLLLHAAHRHFGRPLAATCRMLLEFWPLLLVCAGWGATTYFAYNAWFETLDPATRFSRATRVWPGIYSIAIYAACVVSLFMLQLYRGAFTTEERAFLARITRFGR
jgi:O-antigen/teichoic acid export membrane protein